MSDGGVPGEGVSGGVSNGGVGGGVSDGGVGGGVSGGGVGGGVSDGGVSDGGVGDGGVGGGVSGGGVGGGVSGGDVDNGGDEVALVVDATGLRCPLPVITLAQRFDEVPVGAVVDLLADDPAAAHDVPAWCRLREQEYVGERARDDGAPGSAYRVRRLR